MSRIRQFFRRHRAISVCAIAFALYLAVGALFYPIAGESLHASGGITDSVTPKATLGEFTSGQVAVQSFSCAFDTVESLTLTVGTMARENNDTVRAELSDESGSVLRTVEFSTSGMRDGGEYVIALDPPLEDAAGKRLTLTLTGISGTAGNAISFFYGNTVDTGRVSVSAGIDAEDALILNGKQLTDESGAPCTLCLKVAGINRHWFGQWYWLFYAGGAVLFALYLAWLLHRHRAGKRAFGLYVAVSLSRYWFLIRQLVARDFKAKYKRSVLGMFWSFLNPLLTMSIQYVVFSTIFKSSIPNFVIYLLSGIICFNFFSEATSMCLMSIIGNATLINKVYVPKYIYPFSRTLSSGINLLLSLVPLFLMLLITGTPITPAILLLPFALLMLFLVSYGVGLILATMMVFFRDTQFLWGIFSMLLMYLTPIFYPDSIIPAKFLPIYKLNPLYHVIRFVRSILIDGVSMEPKAYLICAALCLIPFVIGAIVFRKNEDKFVLNI